MRLEGGLFPYNVCHTQSNFGGGGEVYHIPLSKYNDARLTTFFVVLFPGDVRGDIDDLPTLNQVLSTLLSTPTSLT